MVGRPPNPYVINRWECSKCGQTFGKQSRCIHAVKIHGMPNWFFYPWTYLGPGPVYRCDLEDCHAIYTTIGGLNMHNSKTLRSRLGDGSASRQRKTRHSKRARLTMSLIGPMLPFP